MLNLFRQKTLLAGIMLFVLTVLLRVPAFTTMPKYDFIQNAPFARLAFGFISALPNAYLWGFILATILVFLQAIFINYIVSSQSILYKDTFMPGLFYILLNSLFIQQTELTPQLISNTFVLLLLQRYGHFMFSSDFIHLRCTSHLSFLICCLFISFLFFSFLFLFFSPLGEHEITAAFFQCFFSRNL